VERAYVTRDLRSVLALRPTISMRVVPRIDLDRITESTHHEGICLVVRPRPNVGPAELTAGTGPRCLVALDGVENPHNLGAILRIAAHFGVAGLITTGHENGPSSAALRVAQGGAEHVPFASPTDLRKALGALKAARFEIIATTSRGGVSLYEVEMSSRAVFVFGAEGEGVSKAIAAMSDRLVSVPGTGTIESLNVATAAALVLGRWWQLHRVRAVSVTPP